jgi:RNA polymerase sigma factor (sigma-70 family)
METSDKYEQYKELVEKYSKAYYKKVGDLFEYDDLVQEVWVALLSAEDEYEGREGAVMKTFLVTCITNHIINLITKEIQKRQTITDEVDTVMDDEWEGNIPNPEELYFSKELYERLKLEVKQIKHGEFILDNIHLPSRTISEMAKEAGIPMHYSTVTRKVKKIKKLCNKILS